MKIRVIDFETCGFPPDNPQIVEAATVDLVQGESGWARGEMWSSLINPGVPIPPEASAVHHIVDDDVREAPRFDDIALRLTEGADILVAHEVRFEKDCWKAARLSPLWAEAKWICTRKCSMLAWPDAPNHKNQTLRYWLKLKLADPSLAAPHRALGDAYVTAAIMRRLLLQYTIEDMVEASAGPILLPRLTFGEHAMKPLAEVPTGYLEWIVKKAKEKESAWDPDVVYSARYMVQERREAQRNRSPV